MKIMASMNVNVQQSKFCVVLVMIKVQGGSYLCSLHTNFDWQVCQLADSLKTMQCLADIFFFFFHVVKILHIKSAKYNAGTSI